MTPAEGTDAIRKLLKAAPIRTKAQMLGLGGLMGAILCVMGCACCSSVAAYQLNPGAASPAALSMQCELSCMSRRCPNARQAVAGAFNLLVAALQIHVASKNAAYQPIFEFVRPGVPFPTRR
jgi:hypothetical protein